MDPGTAMKRSFRFLDRIGEGKERQLSVQGISSWDDFLGARRIKGISERSKPFYDRKILEARAKLYSQDSAYFSRILPQGEQWRLYDFFRDEAVFLDIEASGVERDAFVTVIGMFDGIGTKTMVRGKNLDLRALKQELSRYKVLVTFNGLSFDVPFVTKRYPEILPEIPHVDLRHLCRSVGLTGGLKEIERQLGIKRRDIIERLYGGDPMTLWRMFRGSGDEYYLNLLVEYNEEDVISLRKIADHAVALKKDRLYP